MTENIMLQMLLDKYIELFDASLDKVKNKLPEKCIVMKQNGYIPNTPEIKTYPILDDLVNFRAILYSDIKLLRGLK